MLLDRLIGKASPAAALRRAAALIEKKQYSEAVPHLARAAEAGLPDAEYQIGRLYLQGSGVPYSQIEAGRWLGRAGLHGHVEAQCLLAAILIQGLAGVSDPPPSEGVSGLFSSPATPAMGHPDFVAAFKWARMAAEAGSSDGQALLGYVLTFGPEQLRNEEEARAWYQRSAEGGCPQGHLGFAVALIRHRQLSVRKDEIALHVKFAAAAELPTAIYILGLLTAEGVGVEQDIAAAVQYFQKAAELGHRGAQFRWGVALTDGEGVSRDAVLGESWLRRAALAGDGQAAEMVGNLYAKGGALPPNYPEAAIWYRRAVEAGNFEAARALSTLYMTGAGVPRDEKEAARWLRVAAEAGDNNARVELAQQLLEGANLPGERPPVADWFKRTAAGGDPIAAFNLGVCLLSGVGVEKDEQQAVLWLRRAAEKVPEAQYVVGRLLSEGRVITADLKAAREYFARAAQGGLADSLVALAEMLANGRGGTQDVVSAKRLFEQAAANGHGGAMFALGAMHGGGYGIPQNRLVAEDWFRRAAEEGHGQAQLMLGRYLFSGVAGRQDLLEARHWFEKAAAQGIAGAEGELAGLPHKTSP